MEGFDIAFQDEGEKTVAKGNQLLGKNTVKEKWYKIYAKEIIVGVIISVISIIIGGYALYRLGWH